MSLAHAPLPREHPAGRRATPSYKRHAMHRSPHDTVLAVVRARLPLVALIAGAFVAASAGLLVPPLAGAALSAVAVALLGGVLALHTGTRVRPVAQPRLGGRAQVARRAYVRLGLIGIGALYVVCLLYTSDAADE
mgnify:CR=1 FL=1